MSTALELHDSGGQLLVAPWSGTLAEIENFWFSERLYHKGVNRRETEGEALCVHVHSCTCAQTCTHVCAHTYTHTQVWNECCKTLLSLVVETIF